MKYSITTIKTLFIQAIEKSMYTRALVYSFLSFLFLRLLTSLVLLIGIFQPSPVFPTVEITQNNILYLEQRSEFSKLFLAPWYRWDTGHYIEIADLGYDFDPVNSVWPPLYPFLIKSVGYIVRPTILSAIFVSNIFFVFGLFLLFLFVRDLFDEKLSRLTLFYSVIFPTSFYFVAGYTESIFLFFSISVFMLLKKKKWLLAGLISALATLTRVQGLMLIIPIVIELWKEFIVKKDYRSFITHLLSCAYAPFAYGLYSFYVFFGLQTSWPWTTLSTEWNQNFGLPWEGLFSIISILLGRQIENDITPTFVKLLSIILPIGAGIILFKIRKKIPFSVSVYSWGMLILVLGKVDINNAISSTIRYLISIFPIFIGQAILINNRYIKMSFLALGIATQIILLVLFYWWFWVA